MMCFIFSVYAICYSKYPDILPTKNLYYYSYVWSFLSPPSIFVIQRSKSMSSSISRWISEYRSCNISYSNVFANPAYDSLSNSFSKSFSSVVDTTSCLSVKYSTSKDILFIRSCKRSNFGWIEISWGKNAHFVNYSYFP